MDGESGGSSSEIADSGSSVGGQQTERGLTNSAFDEHSDEFIHGEKKKNNLEKQGSSDSGISLRRLSRKTPFTGGVQFLDPNDEAAEKISLAMRGGELGPNGRRKSQWGKYLQSVDMKRVMASGTFKLTLLQLARDGEADTLKYLLQTLSQKQCARMLNSTTDEEGVTALHLAAKHDHYDVCKELIEYGANVNIRTGDTRSTPLHYAARNRRKRRPISQVPEDDPGHKYERIPGVIESDNGVISLLCKNGANVNDADAEVQTPLHCACIKGNFSGVQQLLGCPGVNVELKDGQGMTAIHMAATHGHKEIVQALIAAGAYMHSTDNDQMTALHFACSEGNAEIVRLILNKARADDPTTVKKMIFRVDAGKNTGLHVAVGKGHEAVLLELLAWLDTPQDIKQIVNLPRSHGDSPLHIAASQGYLEICEKLVDNGADVDARNDSLATPILLAAHHNNYEIVAFLIAREADIESRDKDNLTPLLLTCKQGHLETLSWLIENGADCSATDKHDKTCLMLAVEEQRTAAVHELLSYEAIMRQMDETDKNANSVLHIAARKGYLPIIKVLLDHGARSDSKNEDEATALHISAQFGQHITLKELLDHDRNAINALDENANTALHLSAIEGHTKCVETLIKHGVNVAFRNTRQMTPLDCACSKGWEATVVILLNAQSAVNPTKGSRTTPLHEACLNGHAQVVKVLLDWRADVGTKIADGRNPLDCAIDQDHNDCVQVILSHATWKRALRNAYFDPIADQVITPARKLIVKMPDMAELAFSRSMTDNRKKWDNEELEVTLDFEFLDDMYIIPEWLHGEKEMIDPSSGSEKDARIFAGSGPAMIYEEPDQKNPKLNVPDDPDGYEAFNDQDKLHPNAVTYTRDATMLRHNHPLMIMVSNKREGLLQHPVVTALLQDKWDKYGGMVYYTSLILLLLFVLILNCYMLLMPPPYSVDFLKSLANRRFHGEFTSEHLNNYTEPRTCYSLLKAGTEYRGYVNISRSNRTCLNWAATSTDKNLYPDAGLDENYCRNPGSALAMPWCFTNYSDNDPQRTVREECDIDRCPVYVRNPELPKNTTCHFPFKYRNTLNNKCIEHPDGEWCASTFNYDIDAEWGFCTENDPHCAVPEELKKPCGSPGTDQLNCEARGCCFFVHDEGLPTEYSECYQKYDECSDWNSYCAANVAEGQCVTDYQYMLSQCPKACGFCNVSESSENTDHVQFLYLMSTYPDETFDPHWREGCYYCLPGAEKKWGTECKYKGDWENPVKIVLMILCVYNLLRLILQIWNYQLEAFRPVFFLEILLYVLCLLLVIDLESFDLNRTRHMETEDDLYQPLIAKIQKETGLRQNWQWQCGVMALFLSWMNLLLYIQKIPYLGIYVVMFRDVFNTFMKFSLVFLLFILSFAFTFHTLLQNEVEFQFTFQSILKATVMMVGELDFTGIFLGGSEEYAEKVNYLILTYIIFSIFIIVMMIIIMNLLVGLAVGDIMEVQEHATLERLKMQVELALEVEFAVPNIIRKHFVRKSTTITPNRYRGSSWLTRLIFEDKNLSTKNLSSCAPNGKSDSEEMHETMQQLVSYVRELKMKTIDHDTLLKELLAQTKEMKSRVDETADIQQQKINLEDEEKTLKMLPGTRSVGFPGPSPETRRRSPAPEPLPAFLRASSFRRDHRASGRRLRASQKRRKYRSTEAVSSDGNAGPEIPLSELMPLPSVNVQSSNDQDHLSPYDVAENPPFGDQQAPDSHAYEDAQYPPFTGQQHGPVLPTDTERQFLPPPIPPTGVIILDDSNNEIREYEV